MQHSIYQNFQRDKLEEDFDELFKNVAEIKEELEQSSENSHDHGDDDIVLAEYVSDDEADKNKDSASEDEEEEDNITKVRTCLVILKCFQIYMFK